MTLPSVTKVLVLVRVEGEEEERPFDFIEVLLFGELDLEELELQGDDGRKWNIFP